MSKTCYNKIDENIYFEYSKDEPLSSDVVLIKGIDHSYFYDVGYSDETLSFINDNAYNLVVIISHFHKDHIGNLNDINSEFRLYGGKKTIDYLGFGELIDKRMIIEDGIKIEIIPVNSSHAKGSLIINVNDKHLFVSDSIHPMIKNGKLLYNTNDLKSMMDLIKGLVFTYAYIGHRVEKPILKESLLDYLESIYKRRNNKESFLEVYENELI